MIDPKIYNKKVLISGELGLFTCGVRDSPKGIFRRATSQIAIFQVATFPMDNFPKVRFKVLRRRRLQCGPNAAARLG